MNGEILANLAIDKPVNGLFFTERQLVVIQLFGRISCWHIITQQWQFQTISSISSYSVSGNNLVLGMLDGYIKYIDMDKFPLRLKDNDILVATLYKDEENVAITAISFMITERSSNLNGWIELAYGTSSGAVRIVLQHPEASFSKPILFSNFEIHSSPVIKVVLGEHHLISVCQYQNHVRTWDISRFRGKLATQPGPTALASYNVISFNDGDFTVDIGPFGEHENEYIFLHRISPESDSVIVKAASTGKKICVIESISDFPITTLYVNECNGSRRMGSRNRRCLFIGHSNGDVYIWDLTPIIDSYNKKQINNISPTLSLGSYLKFDDFYIRRSYGLVNKDSEGASELINCLEDYEFVSRNYSSLSLESCLSQFTLNPTLSPPLPDDQ